MIPTLDECANLTAAAAPHFPGGPRKAAAAVGGVFGFRPSVLTIAAAKVTAPNLREAGRLLFDARPAGAARVALVAELLAVVGAVHVQRPRHDP